MIRKSGIIICFFIILSLGACGKKDKMPEWIVFGNGGNQTNAETINQSGSKAESEESKDKVSEKIVTGNGGDQINVDSQNQPGGKAENEESDVKIGKEKPDEIVIVIDWDKIKVDEKICSDIEDMKDQIVRTGCKKIDLQHTDASKKTLDEVIGALKEIEETLEIDVDYN